MSSEHKKGRRNAFPEAERGRSLPRKKKGDLKKTIGGKRLPDEWPWKKKITTLGGVSRCEKRGRKKGRGTGKTSKSPS